MQKHAGANNLLIQIIYGEEGLNILVEDDGIGFTVGDQHHEGLGLRSVRSRVEFLSGEIDIFSQPGEGASIAIYVPLHVLDQPI